MPSSAEPEDRRCRNRWPCHSNSFRRAMRRWGAVVGRRCSGSRTLRPKFVSVTYGADGSTRERTHECVLRILRETHLVVAPHLTCVNATRAEVSGIAADYWRAGDSPSRGTARRCARCLAGYVGRLSPTIRRFCVCLGSGAGLARSARSTFRWRPIRKDIPRPAASPWISRICGAKSMPARHARSRSSSSTPTSSCATAIAARRRHSRQHRAGNPADHALSAIAEVRGALRRRRAGMVAPAIRRPRRRSRDAAHDRRARRDRAGQRLRRHGVEEFHFYTLNRAELTFAICHAMGCARPCAAPGAAGAAADARVA
jgi:methylenetetrahydrofolate reductase (NADPH)